MRTAPPPILPIFRSEMQLRLLALLLLQPEREWVLQDLAESLDAPPSSVHRELRRAECAGLIARNPSARPHRFRAVTEDAFYEPLAMLLRRSVGVEAELRAALAGQDVVAVIHGSWAGSERRPDSDIDVLVIGDIALKEVRRLTRPISKMVRRRVDVTVLTLDEFERQVRDRSSFVRRLSESPSVPLVGRIDTLIGP